MLNKSVGEMTELELREYRKFLINRLTLVEECIKYKKKAEQAKKRSNK